MKEKRSIGRPKLADSKLKKNALIYIIISIAMLVGITALNILIFNTNNNPKNLTGSAITNNYCIMNVGSVTDTAVNYTIKCNSLTKNINTIEIRYNNSDNWKTIKSNVSLTKKGTKYIYSGKISYNTADGKDYVYIRALYGNNRYTETKQVELKKGSKSNVVIKQDAIYFLNVKGQATVIYSEGKTFLIDAGWGSDYSIIDKFLSARGITKLDGLIFSHMHSDHAGNYKKIIEKYKPDVTYLKIPYCDDENGIKIRAKEILNMTYTIDVTSRPKDEIAIQVGNYWLYLYNTKNVFGENGTCNKIVYGSENTNSLVIVAVKNNKKVMIAGDIDNGYHSSNNKNKNYTPLLNYYAKKIGKVDVYVAAHHGYYNGGYGYDNKQVDNIKLNLYDVALPYLNPKYVIITSSRKHFTNDENKYKKTKFYYLQKTKKDKNLSFTHMYVFKGERATLRMTSNENGIKFTRISNN